MASKPLMSSRVLNSWICEVEKYIFDILIYGCITIIKTWNENIITRVINIKSSVLKILQYFRIVTVALE